MCISRTLAGVLLAMIAVTTVQAAPQSHRTVHYVSVPFPKPRPVIIVVPLTSDRLCMASVIYTEARNHSYMGQMLVGYSVKRRASLDRADFGGPTVCDVVCAKAQNGRSQYSGMRDACPKSWVAHNRKAWKASLKAADHVLAGYQPSYPWSEVMYYLSPEDSDAGGWCWFLRKLVPVGWNQNHLFFREPSIAERALLEKQRLPVQCQTRIAGR